MAASRRPGGGRAGVVGMTVTAPDLIAGYLAELRAGLWVPAGEAELIVAEAEDHLRETAAVRLEIGMTELEAQQAAISSFGPVRAVIWAHRRRAVTAGEAVAAAWKLAGLLAATLGPAASPRCTGCTPRWPGRRGSGWSRMARGSASARSARCRSSARLRWRCPSRPWRRAAWLCWPLARWLRAAGPPRPPGRDPLSPAVTASFFLLVSALLFALDASGVGATTLPVQSWTTPISSGSITTTVPLVPGVIVAGCLAVAAAYGLQTALRRARRAPGPGAPALPGRNPLSPAGSAGFFLLVSALLFALDVSGVGGVTRQAAWVSIPLSSGNTTTTVPLVPGAVVAGCLAVAVGYVLQTARKGSRRQRPCSR